MIRDLMLLPGVPRRLLDDIGEMKELMRELVATNDDLARTSKSMDAKMDKLDVANERLQRALDELRWNEKLDRLDARMARVERELAVIRGGMEEVAEALPGSARDRWRRRRTRSAASRARKAAVRPHRLGCVEVRAAGHAAGTRAIVTRYSGSTRREPSVALFSRS